MLLSLLVLSPCSESKAQPNKKSFRVAVVRSLDLPEYNQAYDGFMAALKKQNLRVETLPFMFSRQDDETHATCHTIREAHPDLILALGTRAAREMSEHEKNTPIVYAMVLAMPDDSGEQPQLQDQPNVTGATLNIPMEAQLNEIRHVFPSVRTIGIISDPSRTKSMVESARALAESHGLPVRVAWAKTEAEIPDALRRLRDSIDVLWMLPDETVLTPRSSRFIIFELIKSGIPVVGLSAAYVKAGALMALDCDYGDIGRQSGELAARILSGQSPANVPQTAPRSFTRALNLKIREHMKIAINQDAIKDSNVVVF